MYVSDVDILEYQYTSIYSLVIQHRFRRNVYVVRMKEDRTLSSFYTVSWPRGKNQRTNWNWFIKTASETYKMLISYKMTGITYLHIIHPGEKRCTIVRKNFEQNCIEQVKIKIDFRVFVLINLRILPQFDITVNECCRIDLRWAGLKSSWNTPYINKKSFTTRSKAFLFAASVENNILLLVD